MEFKQVCDRTIKVMVLGDHSGNIRGVKYSDGRVDWSFEAIELEAFDADDLRRIANKLDELDGGGT